MISDNPLSLPVLRQAFRPFSHIASIRIPIYTVEHNWNGYLEDRRPASNADPYKIIAHIVGTLTS